MAERLIDQDARDRIREGLDRNLVVLAGAGAGKTFALVERMVEVIRCGIEHVEHLAAITFTRKAAGEMRGRFYLALRKAADATEDPNERIRFREALSTVDQCFIGTIHAFCGRLLRERPLDARLPPDFQEADERTEARLRRQAWDLFVQARFSEQDPRLAELDGVGLRTEDLYGFFERRCQFSDLPVRITLEGSLPRVGALAPYRRVDLTDSTDTLVEFVRQARQWVPDPLNEPPDRFQARLIYATNFVDHYGLRTDADRVHLLSRFSVKNTAIVLRKWAPNEAEARALRDRDFADIRDRVIQPALTAWRQAVYPRAASLVDDAVEFYAEMRRTQGFVSFQDLLERAAALLRQNPDVRQALARRYRLLFVDEFQDTDPIQAEIVSLLSSDGENEDWRACRSRPGSLFLVGDEKQSIYRFRRADLDTFRFVTDRIEAAGGERVALTTSFRATGKLCDWINTAFEPLFDQDDDRYQAGFAPLHAARDPGLLDHHVYTLTTPAVAYHRRHEIAALEADRIARFIAACLANQKPIPLERTLEPADFLLLSRTTGALDAYAHALESHRIPFEVAGSGQLGQREEIRRILELLEAIHAPDNPIPLVGYLRGPLVGAGDDDLYAFKKAGGAFHFRTSVPKDLAAPHHDVLASAFDRLRRYETLLENAPPAVALERILDDLGFIPFTASLEMGSSRAGNIVRLLAIVRRWEAESRHWGDCLDELRDLVQDPVYKVEEMTLESGGSNAVRLMNLHQAKGLEAPVVFLVDAYDTSHRQHGPEFHVDRTREQPYLALPVTRPLGEHVVETVAEPEGWEADADREQKFLDAEEKRLIYVAATRAEDLLIVSKYTGNTDNGPWAPLYPFLENTPELPPTPDIAHTEPIPIDLDPDAATIDRENRWSALRQASHTIVSISDRPPEDRSEGNPLPPGYGADYGVLVHDLLQMAVDGVLPTDIEGLVDVLATNAGIDTIQQEAAISAVHAFKRSAIWQAIQTSPAVYTEVDLARPESLMGTSISRGRIDLVYRVKGGWQIVDYKTDRASTPTEQAALVRHYASQIQAYGKHWQAITRQTVVESGIWSTETSTWLPLS